MCYVLSNCKMNISSFCVDFMFVLSFDKSRSRVNSAQDCNNCKLVFLFSMTLGLNSQVHFLIEKTFVVCNCDTLTYYSHI